MLTQFLKLYLLCLALFYLSSCTDTNAVTDVDGNVYKTVKIGNQIWMAENLKVTKYSNGNPIFQVADNSDWSNQNTGAFCNYNNFLKNVKAYGRLYNWYAVTDSRNLAPEGWHLPSSDEIIELVNSLKGDTIAAAKMKMDSGIWLNSVASTTNESGFSALPSGYRYHDGTFHTFGSNGYWWTTTKSYEIYDWSPRLFDSFADVIRDPEYMNYGFAVRCVKDE